MESTRIIRPQGQTGEERYQMLDLNRRLESYLGRVKHLEEENALLQQEIQALTRSKEGPWEQRRFMDNALREARKEVEVAWREMSRVELELGNLGEYFQALGLQTQRERDSREEAHQKLLESRKELEEEHRAQIWLRQKATQLEQELQFQMQIHQENIAALKATQVPAKPAPVAQRNCPSLGIQALGQEYAQRASQTWQKAAEVYQQQLGCLEESLSQAKARLAQIAQEKKEDQVLLQALVKELSGSRVKKELLEKSMSQQKDQQTQELCQLETHVEMLEAEKADLREQIDDLTEERRGLLKLKMSLGLEVATYRALLDTESLRGNNPSTIKPNIHTFSILDVTPRPNVVTPGFHTPIASFPSGGLSHTTKGSALRSKSSFRTVTPVQTPPRSTLQGTPRGVQESGMGQVSFQEEPGSRARWPAPYSTESQSGPGPVDDFRAEDVAEEDKYATPVSASIAQTTAASITPGQEPLRHALIFTDMDEKLVEDKTSMSMMAEPVSSLPKSPGIGSPCLRTEVEPEVSKVSDDEEMQESSEIVKSSYEPQLRGRKESEGTEVEEDQVSEAYQDSESIKTYLWEDATGEAENKQVYTELSTNAAEFVSTFQEQTFLFSEDFCGQAEKMTEHFNSAVMGDKETNSPDGLKKPLQDKTVSERDTLSEWNTLQRFESEGELEVDMCDQTHESDFEVHEEENVTASEQSLMEEREDGTVRYSKQGEMEEKIPFQDENQIDTAREIGVDPAEQVSIATTNRAEHGTSESMVQDAEPGITTAEDDQRDLFHDHDVDDQSQEDLKVSPNFSASWKTDPGESDSYALENTLADTRPLIRYKSDETDVNTQASSQCVTDSSDSEDDREARAGLWAEKAKRFDTMDDLSEEPELEGADEVTSEDLVHPEVEAVESEQEYVVLQDEPDDTGDQSIDTGDAGQMEIDKSFMRDCEEDEDEKEESVESKLNDDLLDQSQEESSQVLDWFEGCSRETIETATAQTLQNEQHHHDDEIAVHGPSNILGDNFLQTLPEDDNEEKKLFEHLPKLAVIPLPRAEQLSFNEETHEIPYTITATSDETSFDTSVSRVQQYQDKPEHKEILSKEVNVGFEDDFLPCESNSTPENQATMASSDKEDFNSSEDESSNASQCSQPLTHRKMYTAHNQGDSIATTGNIFGEPSETLTGNLETVVKEDIRENVESLQIDQWEHSSGSNRNAGQNVQGQTGQIQCDIEEHFDQENYNFANTSTEIVALLRGNEMERTYNTTEKDNNLFSVFITNEEEGFWSATKTPNAATFDPEELVTFGETWECLGHQPKTNGNSKVETGFSTDPTLKEGEPSLRPPQDKQPLDGGSGEKLALHCDSADNSIDEGDSWSSGEE